MNRQPLTVAVVGATGVVGRTMIQVLNEREFPVGELRLLASGRSAGRTVSIDGRTLEIGEAVPEAFDGVDIALFSAGADVSRELAPAAAARGATVIDNSSAWRMDPTIPLVVSQVNPDDLEGHQGIIANPNCSTMQLAPVLMALRDSGRARAGRRRHVPVGLRHRRRRDRRARGPGPGARRRRGPRTRASIPTRSRSTRCPRSTSSCRTATRRRSGRSSRENRKILRLPDLRISCTAVRIPVFVSHSEAVHVETRDPITPDRARELFAAVPGVIVQDDPAPARLPARDRGRRPRRDLRRPGPAGPVDRRRPRARVLGRVGQPAQGRGDERRRDRRGARRARLGPTGGGRGAATVSGPGRGRPGRTA